jgi:hypothetical protein
MTRLPATTTTWAQNFRCRFSARQGFDEARAPRRNMRISEGWLDRVQVVHIDMRDFNPPVKADVLVRLVWFFAA